MINVSFPYLLKLGFPWKDLSAHISTLPFAHAAHARERRENAGEESLKEEKTEKATTVSHVTDIGRIGGRMNGWAWVYSRYRL